MEETKQYSAPRIPKPVLKAQMFLMRRGLFGDTFMIIHHTGRRTGKQYEVPISYLRNGNSILAFTIGGGANWYKNVQQNPDVTLEIKGEQIPARAELVTDPAAVVQALETYKRERSAIYERLLGVPRDMPSEQAVQSPNFKAKFVRFHPK